MKMTTALARRVAATLTLSALALASAACGGQSASQTATPAPAQTAIATPISLPHIDATPLVEVTGLFYDPRPIHVDEQRALGPKPATFAPWDGTSTMLYDVAAGTETNLGPGSFGQFSPDGTRMVWIAGMQPLFSDGEVMLMHLATKRTELLGSGRWATFIDDNQLRITTANSNEMQLLDLRTHARKPAPPQIFTPTFADVTTPDGNILRREVHSAPPFLRNDWRLLDPNGLLLLRFEAYLATPAGRGTLVVETVPELAGPPDFQGRQAGTANIFLVDVASGHATFVGTSAGTRPYWGFDANERYIVWPESYCGSSEGHTRLFDRRTSKITQFAAAPNPRFTPSGLIVVGTFDGVELIDPETLRYRTTIPSRGDSSWSPDYRYASIGAFNPHDGDCL